MGFEIMTNCNRFIFVKNTGNFWKADRTFFSILLKDYLYFKLEDSKMLTQKWSFILMLI